MEPRTAIVIGVLAVAVLVLVVLLAAALVRGARERRKQEGLDLRMLHLELAVAEQTDRLRISGELTGLAAAALRSTIAETETVRRLIPRDPDAAGRAAEHLAESARAAIGDLRRAGDLAAGAQEEARHLDVDPGLDGLDRLSAEAQERGVRMVLEESGERLPLRAGAELAVYRILQQALDNAATHGGAGTTVRVTLRWTEEGVQLLADDDGIRAAARRAGEDPDAAAAQRYTREDDLAALVATPDGRGITEMRERTELFGGVFTATSVAGVGFSISAIFPALLHHNGVHGVRL